MANVGICGYWGWARGQSYVNLMFANMMKDTHKVYVFNPLQKAEYKAPYKEEEFNDDKVKVFDYDKGWDINPDVFRMWIKESNLDAVMFNEYDQWFKSHYDLISVCREEGVKVYGFLVNERFKPEQASRYDRVFCPNMTQVRLMRQNKVRNFTFIPYSLDLTKIEPLKSKDNSKFVFFHPAGMIGVHARKNTDKVIKAFVDLNREDAKLIITSQVPIKLDKEYENIEIINKDLSHDDLMEYYKQAHVTVYPPKWETIGIGLLESLACGTPVITSDFPPMNEYIIANKTGLLCPVTMSRYPDISVNTVEIDVDDLRNKMDTITNEFIQALMQKNSRYTVEQLYDIEKNKKYLLTFLEKDLGDKNVNNE